MAIAEGQFSQIGDYNIKVEDKYGNDGKLLDKVIIHQKKNKSKHHSIANISETKADESSTSLSNQADAMTATFHPAIG